MRVDHKLYSRARQNEMLVELMRPTINKYPPGHPERMRVYRYAIDSLEEMRFIIHRMKESAK